MRADLDALFRARWAAASPMDREMMVAMAAVMGEDVRASQTASRASVAEHMGTTLRAISVPRARLIDKGLIQPAGRGLLEFTIPGFAEFVRELDE